MRGEPFVSHLVLRNIFSMLSTVHFDDQSRIETGKVNDISTEWYLPPEAETIYLFASPTRPQALFGVGHRFSQCSGFEFECHPSP